MSAAAQPAGTAALADRGRLVYRLADGSEWLGALDYREAVETSALAFLAASPRGPMQDADPSLWLEVRGPLFREGWQRFPIFLRPSAVVAFRVTPDLEVYR